MGSAQWVPLGSRLRGHMGLPHSWATPGGKQQVDHRCTLEDSLGQAQHGQGHLLWGLCCHWPGNGRTVLIQGRNDKYEHWPTCLHIQSLHTPQVPTNCTSGESSILGENVCIAHIQRRTCPLDQASMKTSVAPTAILQGGNSRVTHQPLHLGKGIRRR